VRNWGRIGCTGQELVEVFATEIEAGQALERQEDLSKSRSLKKPLKGSLLLLDLLQQ
jgi:predicted DNA-binding WGR domain protein